ncbi:MAG: FAD-dependent oxidoreductase [Sutterella seckii]
MRSRRLPPATTAATRNACAFFARTPTAPSPSSRVSAWSSSPASSRCSAAFTRARTSLLNPRARATSQVLKALKERNVPIRTNVRVTEIIRETPVSGDVRGVRCETKEGVRWIRARQGVVLAAGGFSANKYLRELHDPRVKNLGTDNLPNQTAGDVMMAAVRVGAYLVGMDFIQSTPGAPAGKKMKIILNTKVAESIYVDKRGAAPASSTKARGAIQTAMPFLRRPSATPTRCRQRNV